MTTTKHQPSRLASNLLALTTLTLAACDSQSDSVTDPVPDTAQAEIVRQPDREILVVGGSEVTANRYPWMVAMIERDTDPSEGQFCGGSLISSNWILTAAHCFENDQGKIELQADDVSVLIGERNLERNGGETINVSRIIEHPDYRANGYPDLALVELSQPSSAQQISLPSRNSPVPTVGEVATVTGWGQISENGPATNELKETTMPVVAHQQCNTAYDGEIVEDAMVCAGTADGSADSCYGDSGGPLFVARGESFVQAGVVSFGEACGLPNVPGVYARVSSYYDWIAGYTNVNAYDANSTPQTSAPVASAIRATCEGLECSMTAGDAQATDHYWDFGDGNTNTGLSVEHKYAQAGVYTVNLGSITAQGDYVEESTELTVELNTADSQSSFQHSGRLRGWMNQVDLPMDQNAIPLSAGTLNATLNLRKNRRAILFVDKYDAQNDEWNEVARTKTSAGKARLNLPIESGEYGFTLISRGRGSKFDLSVTVD